MTLAARARELDRKAGFAAEPSPEQWRRAAGRWPWLLGVAALLVLSAVVAGLLVAPATAPVSLAGFVAVWLAFQAGRWKAEDDRLRGRDGVIGGQRRPGGV